MNIEKQLADALRAIVEQREYHAEHGEYLPGTLGEDQCFDDWAADIAETVLAAYDAWPERMATDYRVTTEWDAFDADSPRAAAVEVWRRIRESAGPVFTVRCSDGRVLDVDLSDETDEGVEA